MPTWMIAILGMTLYFTILAGSVHCRKVQCQPPRRGRIKRPLPTIIYCYDEQCKVYGEIDASKINRN